MALQDLYPPEIAAPLLILLTYYASLIRLLRFCHVSPTATQRLHFVWLTVWIVVARNVFRARIIRFFNQPSFTEPRLSSLADLLEASEDRRDLLLTSYTRTALAVILRREPRLKARTRFLPAEESIRRMEKPGSGLVLAAESTFGELLVLSECGWRLMSLPELGFSQYFSFTNIPPSRLPPFSIPQKVDS